VVQFEKALARWRGLVRLDDIRQLTRAQPFRPFRVFLTNGETYDIRHPDLILATLGAAHIAAPEPDGPPDQLGSVRIVSLVHILKIEYLPAPSSQPGANGPA
jgi:hypothetical protein